jgi:GMP synthase-like glutamine amidotransferase
MARIGLLVCDHVPPEFLDVAGDYPDMFLRLFAGEDDIELRPYDLTAGRFPTSLDDCDAWITTGSRRSVYESDGWIEGLAHLVRDAARSRRRFVGVCFGHQMIAHALGGKVTRSEAGWGVGLKAIELPDPPGWLPMHRYRILNSHADQIVDPPPGAVVLGGNDHCPISLMAPSETMIGIQGHPEFPSEYCEALIRARRGVVIPEDVSDAGLMSLAEPPDTSALAAGLARFLRGPGGDAATTARPKRRAGRAHPLP